MKQPQNLLPDDEMTLADLWQTLVNGWRPVLGSMVAALAVAGIYLATTPSQYAATLVVRVGQVGVVGAARVVQQVEADKDAIEWMRSSEFKDAVVESLGWLGDERERLFRYSFTVTSPYQGHLNVKLQGLSIDDARRAARACVAVLADRHRMLAERVVAQRERKFSNLVAEISEVEDFLRRLESFGEGISPNDRDRSLNLSWLTTMGEQKSRLLALRGQVREVRESMKPELNTLTMATEPIIISNLPVYPKTRQVWIFAAIGGCLLGVLLVSLRSNSHMIKANRPPAT